MPPLTDILLEFSALAQSLIQPHFHRDGRVSADAGWRNPSLSWTKPLAVQDILKRCPRKAESTSAMFSASQKRTIF